MKTKLCHFCSQPLPEKRLGVIMSKHKARIFDIINNNSNMGGITSKDIHRILYPDKTEIQFGTIRQHVWQINQLIAGTDFKIKPGKRGSHDSKWRIVKRILPWNTMKRAYP